MKKVAIKKWLMPAICVVVIAAIVVVAILVFQPKGGVAIVKKWKPQRASNDVEPYARRAIKIIDSYLAFEIDREAAKAAFDEVRTRMEELDISYDDKRYTVADDIVSNRIFYLYIEADELTDSEFWEYRDALAFQIGEPVSGRTYPAKRDYYDEEDRLCAIYFDEYLKLADRYSYDLFDDGTSIFLDLSVDFDYMNGVDIKDVYEALEHAWNQVDEKLPNAKSLIYLTYQYYGQDVFSVGISKFEKETGFYIRSAIDFHKMDVENEEDAKKGITEVEDLQSLKEEMEKMAAAFDP